MSGFVAGCWRRRVTIWVVGSLAVSSGGCHRAAPEQPASLGATAGAPLGVSKSATAPSVASPPAAPRTPETDSSFRFPGADRIVAIGDLHGDLSAARRALVLAGAIDAQDRWVGGKLVVVQTGDEIDRGDDDRAVLELFDELEDEAAARGGRVVALVGNHEAMNVSGDFRYVTPRGFATFADIDTHRVPGAALEQFPVEARGRLAAFFPGGPFARRLAERRAAVIVGDTAFVHGGITAEHVRYGIARLNREISRWMSGDGAPSSLASAEDGPLWTRRYSDDKAGVDCAGLDRALALLSAKRMVVGHTPHEEGISAACNEHVFRIDTGLSSYYGGPIQVLEIRGDRVTTLKGSGAPIRTDQRVLPR